MIVKAGTPSLHCRESLLSKEMDMRKHKMTVQIVAAVVLIVVGCGLLVAGFMTPPPGEIHNSVLVAFGEILTFAGSVFGMRYHYKYKYNEKD